MLVNYYVYILQVFIRTVLFHTIQENRVDTVCSKYEKNLTSFYKMSNYSWIPKVPFGRIQINGILMWRDNFLIFNNTHKSLCPRLGN